MEVTVPANFQPRDYQKALYNAITPECRRALVVWHRRAGKDKTCMSIIAKEAFQRVGTYFYILPYRTQAQKIIWEGIDKDGFRFINHIPPQLVARKSEKDLSLTLVNGSVVHLLGSDNVDSLMGTNPVGVIFSEYSLQRNVVWDYIRPILMENNGWAIFNGTPRGRNHLYQLYQHAKKSEDEKWFTEILTIDDTKAVTKEQVEGAIKNGMPRALAMQEFYCSFDGSLTGAYYAEMVDQMYETNRIGEFQYDPGRPVNTAWDLGVDDETVLLFFQTHGYKNHIIDCIFDTGKGMQHYVKCLRDKPYVYGYHLLPHDANQRIQGATVDTRINLLRKLGLRDCRIVPKWSVAEGISAVRNLLGTTYIDDTRCAKLIEAMKTYRAKWMPEQQTYGSPVHDWSSNFTDALRMMAIGIRYEEDLEALPPVAEGANYDPLNYLGDMNGNNYPPEFFNGGLHRPNQRLYKGLWT